MARSGRARSSGLDDPILDGERPGSKRLASARPADAGAGGDVEQRAVPRTGDKVTAWRQIGVELLGQRQAGVRATVHVTVDVPALANRKAVEARLADLQHEVARRAVRDQFKWSKPNARRRGEQAGGKLRRLLRQPWTIPAQGPKPMAT